MRGGETDLGAQRWLSEGIPICGRMEHVEVST
jgi:hypothetical protein